jgi:hypothetical protein
MAAVGAYRISDQSRQSIVTTIAPVAFIATPLDQEIPNCGSFMERLPIQRYCWAVRPSLTRFQSLSEFQIA